MRIALLLRTQGGAASAVLAATVWPSSPAARLRSFFISNSPLSVREVLTTVTLRFSTSVTTRYHEALAVYFWVACFWVTRRIGICSCKGRYASVAVPKHGRICGQLRTVQRDGLIPEELVVVLDEKFYNQIGNAHIPQEIGILGYQWISEIGTQKSTCTVHEINSR